MTTRYQANVQASLIAILGYSFGALLIVAGEPKSAGLGIAGAATIGALLVLVLPELIDGLRKVKGYMGAENA